MSSPKPPAAAVLLVVSVFALQLIRGQAQAAGRETRSSLEPTGPTIATELDAQLSYLEGQFVAAAEAMPEEKYAFVPANGEFGGVRTFALQVRHVATSNLIFFSPILGQALPPGVDPTGATNGPDSVSTKEQILGYLRDSFALGHRAIATIATNNAIEPLPRSPVPFIKTRLGLASFSLAHAFDHYGQMVVYLRANGIVPPGSVGQPPANPAKAAVVALEPIEAAAPRDGQHDFDFDIGTWKTQLSRRLKPLSGSNTWVKYEGTTVVTKVWNGRANLAELEADGPAGHIQVLSLRLYNPTSRQWSLNTANSTGGTQSVPTVGGFKNGRGEFFDFEEYNGRMILVRNVWSEITPDSCRFEQAFSDDGGTTWEVNWIAVDTRIAASAMRQPTRGER